MEFNGSQKCCKLSVGARQPLVFKKTAIAGAKCAHASLDISELLETLSDANASPGQIATHLLDLRSLHEQFFEKDTENGPSRAGGTLCDYWGRCLTHREQCCHDAGHVGIELLSLLLQDPKHRGASILLDAMAQIQFKISPDMTTRARCILRDELAKDPPEGHCSAVWLDIARQFCIEHMEEESILRCKEKLVRMSRWGEALVLCEATDLTISIVDELFAYGTRYLPPLDELVNVAARLSFKSQETILQQCLEKDLVLVSDRFRRACDVWPCPPELNRRLQQDLLKHLIDIRLHVRAAELAMDAGIQDIVLPLLEGQPELVKIEVEHLLGRSGTPSLLPKPSETTLFSVGPGIAHLVDSDSSAAKFISIAANSKGPVGLDCEWPPADQQISTCQVAFHDSIWILDFIWIRKSSNTSITIALGQLFANENVLKLGFSFQEDLDRLNISLPPNSNSSCELNNFIDLHVDQRGLGALLRLHTGFTLDKSMQCSSWGTRPLTEAQIHYAAADALCLLTLYDALGHSLKPGKLRPQRCVQKGSVASDCLTVDHVRSAAEAAKFHAELVPASSPDHDEIPTANVVCFVVKPERRPVAVVTPSFAKVSMPSLSNALHVGKQKIAMASTAECMNLFGFIPGTVPPIGLRQGVDVWLSPHFNANLHDKFCFGSGSDQFALLLQSSVLINHYGKGKLLQEKDMPLVPLHEVVHANTRVPCEPSFVCDTMLGRLAQKLRALGLDVSMVGGGWTPKQRRKDEEALLRTSISQGKSVVLTASTSTFTMMKGSLYLLHSIAVEDQVREICMVFGIDTTSRVQTALDVRCCACNALLLIKTSRELAGQLPKHTLELFVTFYVCSDDTCGKIFWHGSVYEEGLRDIRRIVQDMCFTRARMC